MKVEDDLIYGLFTPKEYHLVLDALWSYWIKLENAEKMSDAYACITLYREMVSERAKQKQGEEA